VIALIVGKTKQVGKQPGCNKILNENGLLSSKLQ